jgi:hypothetical protein
MKGMSGCKDSGRVVEIVRNLDNFGTANHCGKAGYEWNSLQIRYRIHDKQSGGPVFFFNPDPVVSGTVSFKGIVYPFEVGGVTRLIRSAVKNWRSGKFFKKFLMIQSHERSLKPFSVA